MKDIFYKSFLFMLVGISLQANAQNFGIGTNTPLQMLHVNGSAAVTDSLAIGAYYPHAALQMGNALGNKKIILWEEKNNAHNYAGFGVNVSMLRYQTPSVLYDHVFMAAVNSDSSLELMRIKGSGKVGIGASAPAYTLDVNGSTRISADAIIHSNNAGGTWLYLTNNNAGWKAIAGGTSSPGGAGSLLFYNSNNSVNHTLTQDGRLGIGNFAPTEKLDVTGNMQSAGVQVTGNLKMGHIYLYENYYIPGTANPRVDKRLLKTITCPAGTYLLSGGGGYIYEDPDVNDINISSSAPDPDNPTTTWRMITLNNSQLMAELRIYCVCARMK